MTMNTSNGTSESMLSNNDMSADALFDSLLLACRKGDLDAVRLSVEIHRVDPNQTDKHDSSALYYGALCGHADICQYLLERGIVPRNEHEQERIYLAALNDGIRTLLRTYQLGEGRSDPFLEIWGQQFSQQEDECGGVRLEIVSCGRSSTRQGSVLRVLSLHSALLNVRCPALMKRATPGEGHIKSSVRLQCTEKRLSTLVAILEYLYTGRLRLADSEAPAAIRIARSFQLEVLQRELKDRLTIDTSPKLIVVDHRDLLRSDLTKLADCVVRPNESADLTERKSCSDVIFRASCGTGFHCHGYLLAPHSEFFHCALFGPFREASTRSIRVDASTEALAALIEWMYSDQWKETPKPKLCLELLELSSYLLLPRLYKLMSMILSQYCIDAENLLDVLHMNRVNNIDE